MKVGEIWHLQERCTFLVGWTFPKRIKLLKYLGDDMWRYKSLDSYNNKIDTWSGYGFYSHYEREE